MLRRGSHRFCNDRRRGALTVEFALTAPILFGLVLGALEFAHINMVRNTIENAAYEGARKGIIPGASKEDVREEARSILDAVGVKDKKIKVTPDKITNDTDRITVQIEVPLNRNGFIAPVFMRDGKIKRAVTLSREKLD